MIGATGRRVFIGDVHGNYDGLMHLLEAIAPVESDRLYFLGDLIDRGEKAQKPLTSFVIVAIPAFEATTNNY